MSYSISKTKKIAISTTAMLLVLIFWHIISKGYNPLILPSPLETGQALLKIIYSGKFVINTFITVKRTLIGYGLAIFAGFVCALILYKSKFLQYLIRPVITIIQTTPPVAWLVLAIIWFGVADNLTPIFLIFIVTFPVIFINVFNGLDNISKELLEMAQVYNFSWLQIIFNIYLHSLVPHLVSAVSIGLAFAWKSTVFAEFLGSSSGIGFELSVANNNLETAEFFAWTIVLVLLMFIFEYGIIYPLKKLVLRWKNYDK